jgi:acyl-CoA reductase-like NAD-dependent aldehyde dehydrogenase
VYIQEGAFDAFRDKMVEQAHLVVQAIDRDGSADIGHMTSDAQVAIVADHLADALSKGARLLTGIEWDRKSRKIPPLVVVDVNHEMKIMREETFGPVIPLMAFRTENEAIQLANDSEYGLSASVWSKDIQRAERVARGIVTGNVSINNVMLTEGNHALPFGGTKSSGFGRYKGEFGFYAFSNVKSVIIDGDSKKIEANWYPYTGPKFRLFEGMTRGLFAHGAGGLIRFIANGLSLESISQKPRGKS